MANQNIDKDDLQKFLIFQMGEEWFATSLIEIREVIEYNEPKPIPQMPAFFKGVINIRGEIIGVIDLRERLGIKGSNKALCQLIFETDAGPLVAIVDRVQSVTVIEESQLERRNMVTAPGTTDRSYFLGVGKLDDRIVTLISLRKLGSMDKVASTVAQS